FCGWLSALMQAGRVGWLARRFGERALVLAGFVLMGMGMVFAGTSPAFGLMIVAMGAVSVGNGLASPSLAGLASISSSPEEQGSILGTYQWLGSLARWAGPFLGALAFDRWGAGSPLWLGGIVVALASLLSLPLPPHQSRPPVPPCSRRAVVPFRPPPHTAAS